MTLCPHADLVIRLVQALAIAHGRSVEAERVAWGLEGYDNDAQKAARVKGL